MSWYIGLGRTSCENETWSSRRSSRPYGTVRVPDMDPPPSSALSLFILVRYKKENAYRYSTRSDYGLQYYLQGLGEQKRTKYKIRITVLVQ